MRLSLEEERFSAVLRALDVGAGRAQHGPRISLQIARTRLISAWSTARTPRAKRALVRTGARVARNLGLRNVAPVLTAAVLRERLADAICSVKVNLASGPEYPTPAALGILRTTLGLQAEVRMMIERAVRPEVDSDAWVLLMRAQVARLWAAWDRRMPGYRMQVFAAVRAGAPRVRFEDEGFKAAVVVQLQEAARVLDAFIVATELGRRGASEQDVYRALGTLAALEAVVTRGTRNAKPVPTAETLRQRILDAAQTVGRALPETDRYPLAQAMTIYQATLEILDGTRRLVEENVAVGDTQAWTTKLQAITRGLWAFWDRRMPPYRLALFAAKDAQQTQVVMPDHGFKPAVISILGEVGSALERLDAANKQKGTINSETKLYRVLDAVNRFIRGVGSTVASAAGGAVTAAGDAAKRVADGIGVGKALVIGAVVIGGGFVALRALRS